MKILGGVSVDEYRVPGERERFRVGNCPSSLLLSTQEFRKIKDEF